jgi:F0F1-type ATP synthase membrane subunit b/b'
MLTKSEASINDAMVNAMEKIHKVAEEVATAATEKLLGKSIDADIVSKAVDNATKAQK